MSRAAALLHVLISLSPVPAISSPARTGSSIPLVYFCLWPPFAFCHEFLRASPPPLPIFPRRLSRVPREKGKREPLLACLLQCSPQPQEQADPFAPRRCDVAAVASCTAFCAVLFFHFLFPPHPIPLSSWVLFNCNAPTSQPHTLFVSKHSTLRACPWS